MKVLPSVKVAGVYNYETMNIPNLISIIENSDLDKMVVFNLTYHLLDEEKDRFTLEVQKENVPEVDCEVLAYRLFLDGTVVCIFYVLGDEVRFLFVSEMFQQVPKSFEEDLLRVANGFWSLIS